MSSAPDARRVTTRSWVALAPPMSPVFISRANAYRWPRRLITRPASALTPSR